MDGEVGGEEAPYWEGAEELAALGEGAREDEREEDWEYYSQGVVDGVGC